MRGEVLGNVGLHMNVHDNVVTAIDDIEAGATIPYENKTIKITENIPFGHKIALIALDSGDQVVKYGEPIGWVTRAIQPGEWIHTHNCESARGRGDVVADEEVV